MTTKLKSAFSYPGDTYLRLIGLVDMPEPISGFVAGTSTIRRADYTSDASRTDRELTGPGIFGTAGDTIGAMERGFE
jgi:hypothetical protein